MVDASAASYTSVMLDHYIQRAIIYQLAFTHAARFSELKPDHIENKLFTYHLKKVMSADYVEKSEDGQYSLTHKGRRLSTGANDKQDQLVVERAHSVLFLVIRRKPDGKWLFYTRGTYPMLGYSGFIHCNPRVDVEAPIAAAEECQAKTGLIGNFTALGSGYFRIYDQGNLESFTHFTLLYCDDIEGELLPHDDKAEYFWVDDPLKVERTFPATPVLKSLYEQKQPFFIEKTFTTEA